MTQTPQLHIKMVIPWILTTFMRRIAQKNVFYQKISLFKIGKILLFLLKSFKSKIKFGETNIEICTFKIKSSSRK